ncbi:LysR substrate-binding domain-containing protein [Kiloniella majae]|uniref:LysR substrate-binding domain-containing protein n=1 Tax=Kiloniella majae TaxID=1938558 RepID=UPI000A27992A|nr:LysR substrate-binding domain-containing protein [Kiloniella majae]
MAYQLPPLNWLRAFEAAARYNNFTTAAKELNLTPAAVSHQVRSLEKELDFLLFERLARSLKLTDKGRAYLPAVRRAFEDISVSTTGLFGTKGKQTINILCTVAFSVSWLTPRLKDFLTKYPDINIRLHTAIWTESLDHDNIDIDIRSGHGNWPDFHSQKIHTEPSVLVATPENVKLLKQSIETGEKSLINHLSCVRIMGCEGRWQKILDTHLKGADLEVNITVDTSLNSVQLASSGACISLVLKAHAQPDLDSGKLTRVVEQDFDYDDSHYLLTPIKDEQSKPESLLFRNWLLDQVQIEQ